jgi:hypothetical protein
VVSRFPVPVLLPVWGQHGREADAPADAVIFLAHTWTTVARDHIIPCKLGADGRLVHQGLSYYIASAELIERVHRAVYGLVDTGTQKQQQEEVWQHVRS